MILLENKSLSGIRSASPDSSSNIFEDMGAAMSGKPMLQTCLRSTMSRKFVVFMVSLDIKSKFLIYRVGITDPFSWTRFSYNSTYKQHLEYLRVLFGKQWSCIHHQRPPDPSTFKQYCLCEIKARDQLIDINAVIDVNAVRPSLVKAKYQSKTTSENANCRWYDVAFSSTC